MNQDNIKSPPPKGPATTSAPMSAHDFAHWGVPHVAYIKALEMEDRTVFGVFAADGRLMGVMENADVARAAARQNDLEPLSVH